MNADQARLVELLLKSQYDRLLNAPYPAMNQPVTEVTVPYADTRPGGLVLRGNITDPGISPDDAASFEFVDHGYHLEALLPKTVNGKHLTNKQTVERYRKTGQH